MKYIFFIVLIFFGILASAQQNSYSCNFYVRDATTNMPVVDARVTIDQTSEDSKKTNAKGLCDFAKVPVGRIDCRIAHPKYKSQQLQYNVSSEVKNNSFVIDLIPKSAENPVLNGKVEDAAGATTQNAQRSLTEDDKRQLRQQLADVSRVVYVEYQRTDAEAKRYANEVYNYVKYLGFSSNIRYGNPPGRGRFVIKENPNLSRPCYVVNVCARELD